MVKYSGTKLNKLIKEWNKGKVPKTKKGCENILKKTNDELASGYHFNTRSNLSELRYIKYGLQERIKKMK